MTEAKFDINFSDIESIKKEQEKCNTFKESWSDWRKSLYEHGYCVIPNVLSKEKAEYYQSEFWKWLETLNPKIKREDNSTWIDENWPGNFSGILTGYSFGHNQFVWDIRSEQAIIDIFTQVYNTNELLVSFDGGNITRPTTTQRVPWWHVDQEGPGFRCIQGFINLQDCGKDDGGLVIYKDSHKEFEKFFSEPGNEYQYSEYYAFKNDPRTIKNFKDCEEIKVCCNAGDLVLWDSRLIHWACNPILNKGSGKCRMVVYVSYQPKFMATSMSLSIKQQAFQKKIMTTHWASENITLTDSSFADNGDVNYKLSQKDSTTSLPILNETAKKLAGLVSY